MFWRSYQDCIEWYDDKKIQSVDSMEISAYGTSRDLVCRKEEIKYKYIISNNYIIYIYIIT